MKAGFDEGLTTDLNTPDNGYYHKPSDVHRLNTG